jgi:uncharacterized membrane protein
MAGMAKEVLMTAGLIAFTVVALFSTQGTAAPALQFDQKCQAGASKEKAWCCACNSQNCITVYHKGIWRCDGPGQCVKIPCTIGGGDPDGL